MPKRKLTLPTSSRTKRVRRSGWWDDFGRSFFGTLGDPVGTIISFAKGQQPSWNRGNRIVLFDHRKGALGSFLNSMGLSYLKDMISGAGEAISRKSAVQTITRDPRLLAYKLTFRPHHYIPHKFINRRSAMTYLPTDVRRGGHVVGDLLYNFATNPTVRDIGKKAAIATATYAIPKAIDYIITKRRTPKKKPEAMEIY